jgi:energy-coupling factor transporter transmembrane protein EcfT
MDGPRNRLRDRMTLGLLGITVVLVVLEAVVYPYEQPVFPWHQLPGYSAIIGFLFALIVVLLSKTLGAWLLQRPERDD